MIITAKTAVRKIKAGTATITGRVRNDRQIDCISLDDHEHSTVHHVEMPDAMNDMDADENTLDHLHGRGDRNRSHADDCVDRPAV